MAKSTKIIAALGVAGALGIAALPMASYADGDVTSITDTVKITVKPTCSFKTNGSDAAENKSYTAEVLNGNEADFAPADDEVKYATHNFKVVCNTFGGYEVKAQASDLTGYSHATNRTDSDKNGDSIVYRSGSTGDVYTTSGNAGNWTAVLGDGTGIKITKSNAIIKDSSTATTNAGDDFSVTYKVYVGETTAHGTYEGTVVYSLTSPATGAGA